MDEKQLKVFLDDMAIFLHNLNETVMPGKIDPDLIGYLQSTAENAWHLQKLHESLPKKAGLKKVG